MSKEAERLAKLFADRIRAARIEAIDRNRPLDAQYDRYNAASGKHFVQLSNGRQARVDLLTTNAGLATGQAVDYTIASRVLDALPRKKPQRRDDFIPLSESEVRYAAIVWRGRVSGRTIDPNAGESRGQLFVIRNNGQTIAIPNSGLFSDLPSRPFPDGISATVYNGWVTWGEDGQLYVDVLLLMTDASLIYPLHYRVDGSTLTQIDRPPHWRQKAVGNLARIGSTEIVYTPQLLYEPDDRYLLPDWTIHPGHSRVFYLNPVQAELLEYSVNPTYSIAYMEEVAIASSAFSGSSVESLYQELTIPPFSGASIGYPGFNFPEAQFTLTRVLDSLALFTLNFASIVFDDLPPPVTPWGQLTSRTLFDRPGVDPDELTALADPVASGTTIGYTTLGTSTVLI